MKAIALPFLAFLRAADRHLQATVDAGAFFLMRRGLSKGAIRWLLHIALALIIVVQIGATWTYCAGRPVDTIFGLLWAACIVASANHNARLDADADRAGMVSKADDSTGDTVWKALGIAGLVLTPFSPFTARAAVCTVLQVEVYRWCEVAWWTVFLAHVYLKSTPRTPPPIERTVMEEVTA